MRHFFNQSEAKLIVICSDALSRAWRRLYVLALTSDWFIGLSVSAVIGQSSYVTQLKWLYLVATCLFSLYLSGILETTNARPILSCNVTANTTFIPKGKV